MNTKITIYKTSDRRGVKYFSSKPVFKAGFDVFSGDEILLPADRKSYKLITTFKVKVEGGLSAKYPDSFQVKPR